jgi:hypothetical protein
VLEKCKECGTEPHHLSIDFSAAYDSTDRSTSFIQCNGGIPDPKETYCLI